MTAQQAESHAKPHHGTWHGSLLFHILSAQPTLQFQPHQPATDAP